MPVKVATRTSRTGTTAKSTPAKKTASTSPATKTAARATSSPRTRKAAAPKAKNTPAAKRTAKKGASAPQTVQQLTEKPNKNYSTLQERRESIDPRKRIGGLSYKQISELTGYGLGTEQFITAVELITGGQTKLEVSHRIAALLPPTTRNGTPKAISNLVGGVIKKLEDRGFTINGTWKMVAPKA